MRPFSPLLFVLSAVLLAAACSGSDGPDSTDDTEVGVQDPDETDVIEESDRPDPLDDTDPRNDTDPTDPNQRPLADPLVIDLDEDEPTDVLLTGSDGDDDPLSFEVRTSPARGQLTGTPPNLVYQPDADFHGTDRFTYVAVDTFGPSPAAEVVVRVAPVNDPPEAVDSVAQVVAGEQVSVRLSATDRDGDSLTYVVLAPPSEGTLLGTPPNLVYQAAAEGSSNVSFTWQATDGGANTGERTVRLTVFEAGDQPPEAYGQSTETDEDVPLAITLTGQDPEGAALSWRVTRGPALGALVGAGPGLSYEPDPDVYGEDSFAFVVNDGLSDSAEAEVTVLVRPVQDSPVAHGFSLATDEDEPVQIFPTGSDADGEVLSFELVVAPQWGTLSAEVNPIFQPALNVHGTAPITVRAWDGSEWSAEATVEVSIAPLNDPPVLGAATPNLEEDSVGWSFVPPLSDVDFPPQALSLEVLQAPAHGVWSLVGTTVRYDPTPNWSGSDAIRLRAYDGETWSTAVTYPLTVNPRPDPPTAQAATYNTDEDVPLDLVLIGTDPDPGDVLTYLVTRGPRQGMLTGTAPNLRYEPRAHVWGTDDFEFRVTDAAGGVGTAQVTIHVRSMPDPPVLTVTDLYVVEDTSTPVNQGILPTIEAFDPDGDPVEVIAVVAPGRGSLGGAWPSWSYIPASNVHGEDSFQVQANAGGQSSPVLTVPVHISPVNDPPQAGPDVVLELFPGDVVEFALIATDVDGDALSFIVDDLPPVGVVTNLGGGSFSYTADEDFTGMEFLSWHATDPSGERTRDGSVGFNIFPPQVQVQAVADRLRSTGNFELQTDASESVLRNDGIAPGTYDGFVATVSSNATQLGGQVTMALDGRFTYRPPDGYPGAGGVATDQFQYTLEDLATGNTSVASVSIDLDGRVWFVDNAWTGQSLGKSWAPFVTLAAAMARAEAGDVVAVAPSDIAVTYVGSHLVPAGVVVRGAASPIVVSDRVVMPALGRPHLTYGNTYGFELGHNSALRGFSISGPSGAGVFVNGGISVVIEDVEVEVVNGPGVRVVGGQDVELRDVLVSGNLVNGIEFDGTGRASLRRVSVADVLGKGILGMNLSGLLIEDCDLTGIGPELLSVTGTTSRDAAAILLTDVQGLITVTGCTLEGVDGTGIKVSSTNLGSDLRLAISDNDVEGGVGLYRLDTGIYVEATTYSNQVVDLDVTANWISHPVELGIGVELGGSRTSLTLLPLASLADNVLADVHDVGIRLGASGIHPVSFVADGNLVSGSSFTIGLPALDDRAGILVDATEESELIATLVRNEVVGLGHGVVAYSSGFSLPPLYSHIIVSDYQGSYDTENQPFIASVSGTGLADVTLVQADLLSSTAALFSVADADTLHALPMKVALRDTTAGGGFEFRGPFLATRVVGVEHGQNTPADTTPSASQLSTLLFALDNTNAGGNAAPGVTMSAVVELIAPGTVRTE